MSVTARFGSEETMMMSTAPPSNLFSPRGYSRADDAFAYPTETDAFAPHDPPTWNCPRWGQPGLQGLWLLPT